MDNNVFISLLQRHNASTEGELDQLVELKKQYPYSQVLQALVARAARDHNVSDHAVLLQEAAVYAADRGALKALFAQPFVTSPGTEVIEQDANKAVVAEAAPQIAAAPVEPEPEKPTVQIDPIPATAQQPQSATVSNVVDMGVDYADELIKDLERLNALRHNFEMLFVEYSEVKVSPVTRETDEKPHQERPNEQIDGSEPVDGKEKKSKKARIIELAKSLTSPEKVTDGVTKRVAKRKNSSESLIDEIQASKDELAPESEVQKEQIEIINQFIKTAPSISPVKDRPTPPSADLTPVKSGEFSDNVVSETLVEILIKQGKKEKAIEVLKKLIWKYPQKKTYFASQIEDLKK